MNPSIGGKMKAIISFIGVALLILSAIPLKATEDPPVVIAMTNPSVKQIQNMEVLYEQDLIGIRRIQLIGIYHQNEATDYAPSKRYVQENQLTWVGFASLKGLPPVGDLFKTNIWTPQFKKIFSMIQGIIFTGGEDIPPHIYGRECNLLTEPTTPVRSLYECSFLFHLVGGRQNPDFVPFLESVDRFVILGICLGAQTLNVATGGTLIQDIPTGIYGHSTVEEVLGSNNDTIHSSFYLRKRYPLEDDLAPVFHRIKFLEKPIFLSKSDINHSSTPRVLSSHHQSIGELGGNLEIIATSMDGKVPEIIRHLKYRNVIGVQFHPEYRALYSKGKYFRAKPETKKNLNLKTFLKDHPPSMSFHIHLWKWFSNALTGGHPSF